MSIEQQAKGKKRWRSALFDATKHRHQQTKEILQIQKIWNQVHRL